MGEAAAEEAGAVSDAGNVVRRARMETAADGSGVLCADGHTARRADGGTAGALAGLAQPHRALLAPFGTVTMPCSPDQVAIVQSGTIKHK